MLGDGPGQGGGLSNETVPVGGELERSLAVEGHPYVDGPEELKIEAGSVIGMQYEVRRVLGGEGRSGMGVVYVCYDRRARQTYALKTFQDRYLHSNRIRENFRQEALAWVLLDAHPNIVQAVSVEALDNRLFIVLEYIEPDASGRNTLTHFLQSPVSPLQALEWAMQFCDGMAYAASQGVTPHRDIKPDNLMIAGDGTLKITDFGLARFWEGTLRPYEAAGYPGTRLAGTAPWMAPEQFDGVSDLRSDIYSFGIILYQMAAGGKAPFAAGSVEEYQRLHHDVAAPPLAHRLYPIIRKCLKKQPSRRYDDFMALRSDLEKLYRSVAGMEPPAPATSVEPGAWEYNNRGLALYNVGLVDEAIWVYRKALRSEPVLTGRHKARLALVHSNLGVAYDARGQADLALREYRDALRLDPGLADAHNNLGTALRARGLVDEAIAEYREAMRLKPAHAKARHNLGLSFACRGEYEEAINAYREALRLKPGLVEARINLGLALAMTGKPDQAIVEYRRAARASPDDAILHFNLASALRATGDIAGATAEYRATLRIDPANAEAHYRLGQALEEACGLQEAGLHEAIDEYMAALRLDPGHGPALSHVEAALARSGMSRAAIEACLRLLLRRD